MAEDTRGLLGRLARGGGLLGYSTRSNLYPGERDFFQSNPHTAGMATEMGDITLNPYSPPGVNHEAVARNEAMRLLLRDRGLTPSYGITDQQRQSFRGTPYEGQEGPIRETIAARLYSGDPSARATPEQMDWLFRFMGGGR